MSKNKPDLHPFGELLTHYLWKTRNSQSQFAEETDIADSVISRMKHGQRLKGDNARERVLKMIEFFHQQGVLTTRQEANEFLAKAGMLPLTPRPFDKWCGVLEPELYEQLVDDEKVNSNGRAASLPALKKKEKIRLQLSSVPQKVWWGLTAVPLLIPLLYVIGAYYQTRGWTLRIYRTDDLNVVLVNDQIIAVDESRYEGLPITINLNKYLTGPEPAVLTLVNVNSKTRAWWDFELRYDNSYRWRYDGQGDKEYQMNYMQQLQLMAEGQVIEIPPPPTSIPATIPITVTLDVQELALVLVNGYPVGVASDSASGEFVPVEISPYLQANQPNTLEFKFWSPPGNPYRWKVEIWQDDLLWRCNTNGIWPPDGELGEQFRIDEAGDLIYETLDGSCHQ